MNKSILERMALGLLLVFLAAGCVSAPPPEHPEAHGRVVFALTDAAANMESVSSVEITVDSVEVHSATEGWVTVSSTPQTYDLLELQAEGSQVVLADVELDEGTYQQVRLHISQVVVTDAEGEHEATLPSGELRVVTPVEVNANTTSTVTFDFIANESLHVTGEGEYVMAPVVQVESRENAQVTIRSNNRVDIQGGSVTATTRVGMGIDGTVGVNVRIPANAHVSIDNGVVVVGIGGSTSGEAEGEAETNAEGEGTMDSETEANASADVEVNASVY